MLRHFYILYLLLEIECALCFDYISGHSLKRNNDMRRNKSNYRDKIQQRYNGVENYKARPEYDMIDDKESVAQIDVASFIQKPDEYTIDDSLKYDTNNKKSQIKSNNLYIYEPIDETSTLGYVTRNNKRQFHINSGAENPPELNANARLFKDTLDPRQPNLNSLSLHELNNVKVTRSRQHRRFKYEDHYKSLNSNVHTNEKKCLKHLKFPFFSHKNDSVKAKKEKKRKIFCFNCSKKDKSKEESTTSSDIQTQSRRNIDLNKRSNEIQMVTLSKDYNCYRHNSRQFPQINLDHDVVQTSRNNDYGEDITKLLKEMDEDTKQSIIQTRRERRSEWSTEKMRQMKELDDLQKKIDHLDIASTANQ